MLPAPPNIHPVGTLCPSWRHEPSVKKLLDALSPYHDKVWFVGGCVRDALLGNGGSDIDLAAALSPDQVQKSLSLAGIPVALYGLAHGTVTALVGGQGFEITTLRYDVQTFGRHASVSFDDVHWFDDAARRDFTFNALYLTPEGILYDPFNGRQDLAEGRVRFIGDSRKRICEDYLRILRFYRFYALFGREPIDSDAARACAALGRHMGQLSAERVRGEFFKLLSAPNPIPALNAMGEADLFTWIFKSHAPNPSGIQDLKSLLDRGPGLSLGARSLILWGGYADARGGLIHLKAPNALLVDLDMLNAWIPGDQSPFEIYYRHGPRILRDILLIRGTPRGGEIYDALVQGPRPVFPLTGKDLLDLNVAAGPGLGALLKRAEAFWIEQGGNATREACLAFLGPLNSL